MNDSNLQLDHHAVLRILQPGNQASLQDLGRPGFAHLGVGQCGALDHWSVRILNILLGNPEHLATVEFAGNQFLFAAKQDCTIAIGSYSAQITINDQPESATCWKVIQLYAGDNVCVRSSEWSTRHYIAVRGGFSGGKHFESVSTDYSAQLGGNIDSPSGEFLKKDALLHQSDNNAAPPPENLFKTAAVPLSLRHTLRCLPGPEFSLLSDSARESLWTNHWNISRDSNRMGYRLQTERSNISLDSGLGSSLASHAVFPGTIQLPTNGQPLILLADAGTTGGYPRIAKIIDADLWMLAHLPVGQSITLQPVEKSVAIDSLGQQQSHLEKIRIVCQALFTRV